ncbi:MAG: amidoligase family protein [Prevotellaceae bacterium]|nr:amidoligase family protein [Prevotellaceae bacterium]
MDKTLNEQIAEVMNNSSYSEQKKKSELKKIGLRGKDIYAISMLYKVQQTPAPAAAPQRTRTTRPAPVFHTLGIEMECFNVATDAIEKMHAKGLKVQPENYNHTTKNYFKVVTDASIRGHRAAEFVSPVLTAKEDLNNLKKLCETLQETGAEVNKTCGLHVHVGLQKISFETYKNIFINYSLLEKAIDKFMAKSRREDNNQYSKSLQINSEYAERLARSNNYSDISSLYYDGRYFKVNPISIERHNTIEFRQHQGTIDFEKINNWINFITKLIEFSKETRLEIEINDIENIPFLTKKEKQYFINRAAVLG